MSANDKSPPRPSRPGLESKAVEPVQDDTAHKRKASSPPLTDHEPPISPKRSRVDDTTERDASSKSPHVPKDRSAERRQGTSQEERSRGKRLYGSLLNTLSQTTANSQQKRRQEIERRQQAKASQQRAEDDKHRQEKLARLNAARKVEQIKFDEQVMRTRHLDMLAKARFLHTRNCPSIYYSPWEKTPEQRAIIQEQIREAENIVDREVSDFRRRKEQRLRALGVAIEPPTPETKEALRKTVDERPTDTWQSDSANHAPSNAKVGHVKESDDAGDVMVEEAEDTVIY
ncbi:hypothetical protein DL764_000898 [Monosporascus ibericus]|uniref:Pinin/SDK/MemA protein domain-containing protein n=1 Tax=Monosporascus ibericus TaxID=155417 RepID=A0A4Q4TV85_9PEZI|nr:hypothetical protein DL764_000898 [Monosporascus ibericus]